MKPELKINDYQHTSKLINITVDDEEEEFLSKYKKKEEVIKENNHKTIDYRPDIDGLRSVAVSIVILFHFWPKKLPGGFIGVDVFFVISGYLISSILFKEIANNNFVYSKFYSRRIKRLYPALLLMLISVIFMGVFKLSKSHLKSLFEVIISSSLFSSNLYFLYIDEGDYFNNDTKRNPLLHLWSLGVEEQFYMVWPIIAILIVKLNSKLKGGLVIGTLIMLSFILNMISLYQLNNDKFAFYFPLSRFWQMLVGCVIAYYHHVKEEEKSNFNSSLSILYSIFSFLSLASIIVFSFILSETDKYPGYNALFPTIASGILIFIGNLSWINQYILSSSLLVYIGKISYPLYLWHYPFLVFLQKVGNPLEAFSSEVLLIITIIFGILTYTLVESKLKGLNYKNLIHILVFLMFFILVVSLTLLLNINKILFINSDNIFSNSNKLDFNTINMFDLNTMLTPYSPYTKNLNYTSIKNLSILPPQLNTTVEKLKYSPGLEEFFYDIEAITSSSEYYTSYGGFVFNEGKEQKVIFLGDSHVEFAIYRAYYLKDKYGSENFPTVIIKQMYGNAVSLPCMHTDSKISDYEANMEMVKKVKPYSVFIAGIYDAYINQVFNENEEDILHDPVYCCGVNYDCKWQSKKDVDHIFNVFTKNIKELTEMGIKVYVATLKPIGEEFNPKYMYDSEKNLLIDEKLKPVKQSEYLIKNKILYNRLNKAILDGGASIIDYTDNLCYKDNCNVIDPTTGYPVNKEESHPNNYIIREYFDVLDKIFGK